MINAILLETRLPLHSPTQGVMKAEDKLCASRTLLRLNFYSEEIKYWVLGLVELKFFLFPRCVLGV